MHITRAGSVESFLISTVVVSFVGQIIPQAILPLYILEATGRFVWILRLLMYVLAVPAAIPAYGLRLLKRWRLRDRSGDMEGLLSTEELLEFVRLHEKGENMGGRLDDDLGKMIRSLLQKQLTRDRTLRHLERAERAIGASRESRTSDQVLPETTAITRVPSQSREGSTALEEEEASGMRNRGNRDGQTSGSTATTRSLVPNPLTVCALPRSIASRPVSLGAVVESLELGKGKLTSYSNSTTARKFRSRPSARSIFVGEREGKRSMP